MELISMNPEPTTGSTPNSLSERNSYRSMIEDYDAGTDIASALGKFITRLHKPARSFIKGVPMIKLEEDGFHIIIPWYDGGVGDALEISLKSNGRRVECGKLEGVPMGGCIVTKPRSIPITAIGFNPLTEIRIFVDGKDIATTYNNRMLTLNDSFVAVMDPDLAEYIVVPSYASVWVKKTSNIAVHSRFPGITVFALNGSPASDIRSYDLRRSWPRIRRTPGTISFLPDMKESYRKWESSQWRRDPSGRMEKDRVHSFHRILPESCMAPHIPRFGFVGKTVKIFLASEGPYIRIPPLEYMEGSEPPLMIKQGSKEFVLPLAGTTACGGYRVRIRQLWPIAETGFNPIRSYTIISGDEVLFEHQGEKALYFNREGSPMRIPVGECFVLTDTSSGWRVNDARYLENAVMWKFGISRIFVPADVSHRTIETYMADYYEAELGDCEANVVVPIYEEEAPVEEEPRPVVRPKRLKTGQVLEDGAIVCTPIEGREIQSLSLKDMKHESDAAMRKRILRSILEHTGDWASDPHPPAYRFIGPPPRLTMSSFDFVIRLSCYECSEDDRMLVEVSQNDSTRVLYPLPPSIEIGGCRIMDEYAISIGHLGMDPFGKLSLKIDGREAFSMPEKDILLFSADGSLIDRSDGECIACHREGFTLNIDGIPVDSGMVEGGFVFTSIKGRFDSMDLTKVPEITPQECDVSEPSETETTCSDPSEDDVSFVCHDDCPDFNLFAELEPVDSVTIGIPEDSGTDAVNEECIPSDIDEERIVPEDPAPSEESEERNRMPVPEAADPGQDERAELLAKASALYERQVDLRNREISDLSLEDIFDDSDDPAAGGRAFLGSGPDLFFSGTRTYLFIPPYCGLYGDRFQLMIRHDGGRIDLGKMEVRKDEPLVTQKRLIDLAEEGIHPLKRFEISIDNNTIFRGRFPYFLLFNAEGRHLMSIEDSHYVLFSKDCRIDGSGINFEESYAEDGTGLMTILDISEDGWFKVIRSDTPRGSSRITILPDYGFLGKMPEMRFDGKAFVLSVPSYRCRDDDPCVLSFESAGRSIEYGRLATRFNRKASATLPNTIDLDSLGIDVLDGFTANIDGAAIFSTEAADHLIFDSNGPAFEPAGDVWMIYRRGLLPSGMGCEIRTILNHGENRMVKVRVPIGDMLSVSESVSDSLLSCPVHYEQRSSNKVSGTAYIRQLRSACKVPDPDSLPGSHQESSMEDVVEEPPIPTYHPDSDIAAELVRMMETYPMEECEPRPSPDYATGYGFFDYPPRLFVIRNRPVLAVPPYSGSSDDEFHASVESSVGTRDLGILPRESEVSTAFTSIDVSDADIPGGFRLVIDDAVVFEYPASGCSIFSATGIRTDILEGDVTILLDESTALEGSGFQYRGMDVPGGYRASVSISEESFIRIGDAKKSDGRHIVLWPDRTFVDHRPSIRYSESGPAVRIPDYRCLESDPCEVEITSGNRCIALGRLYKHPGLGAAIATGKDFDLDPFEVNVLDGFSVSIDGTEVFRSGPLDYLVFSYSGHCSDVSRGDVTMIHRPDLVPSGKDFRISDEQDRPGYRIVKARVGPRGRISAVTARVSELQEEESEADPVVAGPSDDTPNDEPTEDGDRPLTLLESVRLSNQTGFVNGTPFLEYRNDVFQIHLPSYRALPGSEMECWLAQSGVRTRPFKLSCNDEDGFRTSRPVLVVIPEVFDPLVQFGIYIDGAMIHREPDRRIMFFPERGGRRIGPGRGRLIAVYHSDEHIVCKNTEVEWTRDIGGIRVSGARILSNGFFGPERPISERSTKDRILREYSKDDLLRSDGLLESEYAMKTEAERKAEEERRHIVISAPEAGTFRDGGPTLMFDGHGFLIHIPSYAAEEDRMLSVVLFVGGAPVSNVRLEGPVISGVRITEPVTFPLSDFRSSPFDEIEVLMDGETIFKKDEGDLVVLDEHYRYKGILEGRVHAVVRKNMRYIRRRVTEKSRIKVTGALIITLECAQGASMEAVPHEIEITRIGFTDGYPSIRYRDGRFSLYIPRYLGRPNDPYETVIACGKRRIPAPPLKTSSDSHSSRPISVDLTSMDVSPLEEFSLLIDGEMVFINRATDRMIFDSEGNQQISVVGKGYVVVPRNARTTALGAGTVSSRIIGGAMVMDMDFSDGGVLEVGRYIGRNDYAKAIRVEEPGLPIDSSADVSIRFTDEPIDIVAYPSKDSPLGQAYIAQGIQIPPLPFFGRIPGVEVAASGCSMSDCTIRVENMDGRILFGPVQVTTGRIELDTAWFNGLAQAVVSVNGEAVKFLRYFIDMELRFELPRTVFYTKDSAAKISTPATSFFCSMFYGKMIELNTYSVRVRFNIVRYYVNATVKGKSFTTGLEHISVQSKNLSGIIRIYVKITGNRTPMVRKRILAKSERRVVPLTRSVIDEHMKVQVDQLKEMMAGKDFELFIEEEGRGTFNFMTVRWSPDDESDEIPDDIETSDGLPDPCIGTDESSES